TEYDQNINRFLFRNPSAFLGTAFPSRNTSRPQSFRSLLSKDATPTQGIHFITAPRLDSQSSQNISHILAFHCCYKEKVSTVNKRIM
ncbi:MAG: hypothetical protein ABGW78_12255, partial [Pirellulales bacterium]